MPTIIEWSPHRVECGGEFSVLVTDNGILMTCGSGDQGAQGHHDNHDCLKPKLVEDLITHDVIQVTSVTELAGKHEYLSIMKWQNKA